MAGKRVAWIDTAKAIGILLVIVAHTAEGSLRALTHSFAITLFIVLSAWTTRFAEDNVSLRNNVLKAAKHLLIPTLIIFSLRSIFQSIKMAGTATLPEWKTFFIQRALTLLFSSGYKYTFLGVEVPALGIPWFLVVLFFSRSLYDALQLVFKNNRAILAASVCFLSVLGVVVGRAVFLFFSFDIALASLPFIMFSHIARRRYTPGKSVAAMLGFGALWIICFIIPFFILPPGQRQFLGFTTRDYPLYPLCFVGSIFATLFVTEISARINSSHLPTKIVDAVNYLGRNSLYMIYVHCFDKYWKFLYSFTSNSNLNCVFRIIADIIAFALLMKARELIINRRQNTAAASK